MGERARVRALGFRKCSPAPNPRLPAGRLAGVGGTETERELWGGETRKAVANFTVSGRPIPMPAPIAGCMMSTGATTVAMPIRSAGHTVGARVHCEPTTKTSTAANATPMT